MKTFKILSIASLFLACSTVAIAQSKTATFKVNGVCGMCKSKIEKAAKEAGAKTADWNEDTKDLTVSFKSSSTNTAKIQQKIAEVGYDNAGAKASDESYNKLHGCCKYDRSASVENEACCEPGSSCCKDGKCTKHGVSADGKACCSGGKCTKHEQSGNEAACCKDGKCTKEGHSGTGCCSKEAADKKTGQ